MAPRAMNEGDDERSLACFIERSAELKRALVGFALSPRMGRHLERFMVESAGPHKVLIEDETIDAIDRFALLYRLPNGKTVLDQFLASWPDLSAADWEVLRGWRDPVDGIFEIRGKDRDSLILLNLVDDRSTARTPTWGSGRSCASRISPGPSTARLCCAGVSPGTTSTNPVPTAP